MRRSAVSRGWELATVRRIGIRRFLVALLTAVVEAARHIAVVVEELHIAEEEELRIVVVHKVVEENLVVISSRCHLLGIPTHVLVVAHHIVVPEEHHKVVDMPLSRVLCEYSNLRV